jgi:hypothetical protein
MCRDGSLDVSNSPTKGVCEAEIIPDRCILNSYACLETSHLEILSDELSAGILRTVWSFASVRRRLAGFPVINHAGAPPGGDRLGGRHPKPQSVTLTYKEERLPI